MKARICCKGFNPKESEKLKPFLYIGDHFAERWGRAVIFDAPHGCEMPCPTESEGTSIHVHFFSAPPSDNPDFKKAGDFIPFIFGGFTLPSRDLVIRKEKKEEEEEYFATEEHFATQVSGNDVAVFFKPREGYPTIGSSAKQPIAQVANNHIYILFDLSHRPWEGDETVLWEIFEMATPYLSLGERDALTDLRRLTVAHEKSRSRLLKRKETFRNDFKKASCCVLEKEHRKILSASRDEKSEMINLEKELMELAIEIEMIKQILEDPEKDSEVSRETLSQEFDLIHAYKGLLGIKVEEGKLHIFTEPIEYSSGGVILSQFEIIINPGHPDALHNAWEGNGAIISGIKMREWGWRGPYAHPEGNISGTYGKEPKCPCFGQDYLLSVKRVYIDQDYKVLIALLLHYLDSDSRPPLVRPAKLEAYNSEYKGPSEEPYEPKPFYPAEEDRNKAREDYINFVKDTKGSDRKNKFEEMCRKKEAIEVEKTNKLIEIRKSCSCLSAKADFIRSYLDKLPLEEELEKIFNLPALNNMKIGSDFVWCVFGPAKGRGRLAEVWFGETIRVLIMISSGVISIFSNSLPKNGLLLDSLKYPVRIKKSMKLCRAKGLYGTALIFLHDVLRGEEIGEKEVSELEKAVASSIEEFTAEKITKWIHENFPFA